MSVFDESYARYYDLLYADKDYKAEVGYVASLLRKQSSSVVRVLELGCGTGKHAVLLSELGFVVHGVDRSEQMVKLAIERASLAGRHGQGLTFAVGDVTEYRTGSRFDAVISLFHVVSYQTTNTALSCMFSVAADHLSEGGVFIFDVWYGPAVLEQKPAVRVKRLADSRVDITRIAEPSLNTSENTVDVQYSIHSFAKDSGQHHEFKECHKVRYLFLPELDLLLSKAGFRLERAEEWMTGAAPSSTTWGVTIVAAKRDSKSRAGLKS